jgi:hypothetical protein
VTAGTIKQEDSKQFISKITRAKRAGGVAQAIELLPSKHQVLRSNRTVAVYLVKNTGF